VAAHRLARGAGLMVADRLEDAPVLLLDEREVRFAPAHALGQPGDRAARDEVAADELQEARELGVAGGLGDGAVEGEVLAACPACAARAIASSAAPIAFTCAREARSAAMPADSISTPRRSSITFRMSASDSSRSGSMRNGARCGSAETNAPTPWRVMTRPSARSAATASRTTVRLTRAARVSASSVGRREPGASRPLLICSASCSNRPRDSLRAEARGRILTGLGMVV
jgi:hypothetical protein